ncbi:unnamed protein product [Toxocara canis]|uniref:PhoLip_ATPase_C domain-containing protein n=1 Tax=Toxocara canis TaxID=6265 RepID=A0A183U4V5_TOXCA|nr:unnamed protein product [Toxocara canis]
MPYVFYSSTVRLLLFRAVANLLFSISLIPNYIYSVQNAQRQAHMPYTVRESDTVEIFYWFTLKFVMFASNVLNTISVWSVL